MNNISSRLLGIDYGSKRIGISLTDESGSMAMPYLVIQNSEKSSDEILKICTDKNVSTVVVGESKDFSGTENKIMKDVHDFVERMRQSGLTVVLHPEFLTSFQAERVNYELRGTKDMIDASAATLILQSYIDSQTHSF